ncbi:MAG: hydrogenase [Candidatus Aminicenantes bacterium]|nr:hydrogenase [Candidatus Aminicenantes bacterium]
MNNGKLKIGIFELTGCAGDALLILDCEKELLDIFKAVDIQVFLMASSEVTDEKLDIALVEGSVSTEKEIEELKDIRERAEVVVAIGICATVGGIQARFTDPKEWENKYKEVYGDIEMTHTKAVPSKPIDAYITVDTYLPGCPIGKDQFLNLFTRVVKGNLPERYPRPVCVTCKYNENDCLLNKGIACLGPLTEDGCGSICPNHNVPCFGCWGPVEGANLTSEYHLLQEKGFDIEAIKKQMANYSGTKLVEFFKQLKKESK